MTGKAGGSDIVRDKTRNKSRRKGLWGIAGLLFGLAASAGLFHGMTAVAAQDGSGTLRSRGSIRFEQAVIDAADLQSIQTHITEKKNATAGILQQLGTKFRQQAGGIVPDRNPDAGQGDADLSQIGWPTIVQAVSESQKVPDGLPVLNPEAAIGIEGVGESTQYYVTAAADNISRGKAAWADGRLLLGNGADNDRAYQAGTRDGREGRIPEFLNPLFAVREGTVEIRHVHIGKPKEVEGISGCYKNKADTQTKINQCGAGLIKTEAVWYPNPEEPDGGSWHGGFYTCPYHSGAYEAPGNCTYEETVTTTVWSHKLVCGLEDAVYARLTVRGTDTDPADKAVRLEAVLEEGEAYGRLAWAGEEKLIWTDEGGNALGTGPELTVRSPGLYRCGIHVTNEDIDRRETEAVVKVSGLALRN